MDSKFTVPCTRMRFGLDPLFSLIPGLGDFATYLVSGVLIYTMYRHGASGKLVVRMTLNATLDAILGAIPIVGTIFDFFYKANDKNVRLLKEHYVEGKHQGSGKGLILVIAAVLSIIAAALLLLVAKVLYEFFEALF